MHEFNFSNNPIKDWFSDQNFILLDPTAKGFFSQLVLSSSQTRPYGHITSNEKRIKKIIGIPHIELKDKDFSELKIKKNDTIKTLEHYFSDEQKKSLSIGMLESLSHIMGEDEFLGKNEDFFFLHNNYNYWLNFLWKYKWKSQLETVMLVIDEELIKQFPELENKIGDYFIPIAYNIGFQQNNNNVIDVKRASAVKKSKKTKNKIEIIAQENIYFSISYDTEIKEEGLVMLDYDHEKLINFKHIHKSFHTPLNEKEKTTIWDLGVQLISTSNNDNDIKKSRSMMARAMKKYGKDETISAITKMSLVKEKQLDPYAYFIKLLEISKVENQKIDNKVSSKIGNEGSFVFL